MINSIKKEKYINAILYFLNKQIKYPTKTKIFKLLYYLDFDHFEKYGQAVTNDQYVKKTYGPVPSQGEKVLQEMKRNGLIKSHFTKYFDGSSLKIKEIEAQASYEPRVFKSTEMDILSNVSERWEDHTANQLEDATHGEAPWIAAKMDDVIDYPLAYYRNNFGEMDFKENEI